MNAEFEQEFFTSKFLQDFVSVFTVAAHYKFIGVGIFPLLLSLIYSCLSSLLLLLLLWMSTIVFWFTALSSSSFLPYSMIECVEFSLNGISGILKIKDVGRSRHQISCVGYSNSIFVPSFLFTPFVCFCCFIVILCINFIYNALFSLLNDVCWN